MDRRGGGVLRGRGRGAGVGGAVAGPGREHGPGPAVRPVPSRQHGAGCAPSAVAGAAAGRDARRAGALPAAVKAGRAALVAAACRRRLNRQPRGRPGVPEGARGRSAAEVRGIAPAAPILSRAADRAPSPRRRAGAPGTPPISPSTEPVMSLRSACGVWRVNGVVSTAVVSLGLLGGCNNAQQQAELDSLKADRDRLVTENQQMTETLKNEQAARAEAEAKLAETISRPLTLSAPESGRDVRTTGRPSGGSSDVVLEVAGDVAFQSGQATLTAQGKRELDTIARTIRGQYSSNRVRVDGYTDKTPIRRSKWGSNQALSQARADAVRDYLIQRGISAGTIESVGRGSTNLRRTDAQSRRVEIVILGN
ncbi:MAG: hypothetical protein C0513_07910 [Isosphaera sp.]|nr:hypothetical protein [Isosphaera sp.]